MYKAKIVADSISEATGTRVTSIVFTSPLSVHAEFMTHRAFTRNAASSRAIPIGTMISRVKEDPFLPVFYGMNRKGMQAVEEANPEEKEEAERIIRRGSEMVISEIVNPLVNLGLHKQIVNRYMAPWLWIEVLMTATDVGMHNWFALRDHKAADPSIRKTAELMLGEYNRSTPTVKHPGEWHMPFAEEESLQVDDFESCKSQQTYDRIHSMIDSSILSTLGAYGSLPTNIDLLRAGISSGRSARISYKMFDGTSSAVADLDLFYSLADSVPKHASPTEHPVLFTRAGLAKGLGGNLFDPGQGLVQFRKILKNEVITRDPRIRMWRVEGGEVKPQV